MRTRTQSGRRAPAGSDLTWVLATMYSGLALTVLAALVPYVGVASDALADHIRAGYPTYSQARIHSAVTTYQIYLSVVGVLGVAGWLWTLRALRASKPEARAVATSMFALGTGIALTDLLIRDTSGETGLPASLGWIGILPCLPGLLAITLLWLRHWPVSAPHTRSHFSAKVDEIVQERTR